MRKKRAVSTFLLVGLGNPGKEYELTRHNLGFRVIDRLSSGPFRKSRKSRLARDEVGGRPAILAKPTTYVNLSGEAVLGLLTFYRLSKSNLLVICDDISLPFGKIRFKEKGSSGGHNGLQSIIEAIGPEFPRIRIGIGAPPTSADWADYVLTRFRPEEEKQLPEIIERAAQEVSNYLKSAE